MSVSTRLSSNGPKAVDFFITQTSVRFDMPLVFPDYHAEAPGGTQGGRSMVARPFDGKELGDNIKNLAPALTRTDGIRDDAGIRQGNRALHARDALRLFRILRCEAAFKALRPGNALRSRHDPDERQRACRPSCEIGLRSWRSALAVLAGKGIDHRGWSGKGRDRRKATDKRIRVNAKRAVVLACGGFPHDVARRKELFPHAPTGQEHYSPGPTGNTGDGLRLAEKVGGKVNTSLPHAAAWVPVSVTTRKDGTKGVMPHFIDRAKPGVIAVTADGKRFTNEGNSYHDFVKDMVAACANRPEVSAYLICDHRTLRKYGLGCVAPFPLPMGRHLRTGYLKRGATLAQLAEKIGIGANVLESTVRDFNGHAREGKDPTFGKGSKAYNRYQGDALHSPNPCLAPLEHGPFYAIKLVVGDLGTYAGLITDQYSRVLDGAQTPISGLYAVGNDISSIMGGNYPGAGITLGPALTFGHIAGCHIAGVETGPSSEIRTDCKTGSAERALRGRRRYRRHGRSRLGGCDERN